MTVCQNLKLSKSDVNKTDTPKLISTMKGLDTVESLSVEVKRSKNPGKRFLVCTVAVTKTVVFV